MGALLCFICNFIFHIKNKVKLAAETVNIHPRDDAILSGERYFVLYRFQKCSNCVPKIAQKKRKKFLANQRGDPPGRLCRLVHVVFFSDSSWLLKLLGVYKGKVLVQSL